MTTSASPKRPEIGDEEVARETNLSVSMSPLAVKMAKKQLEKRGTPESMIRVGLRGGGCSGYSYVMEFEDRPAREKDRVFEFDGTEGERVRLVVDPKSLVLMNGTVLDYETSVMGHGFKFVNPQVKGTCGCGASIQF